LTEGKERDGRQQRNSRKYEGNRTRKKTVIKKENKVKEKAAKKGNKP
jgi:hypothetical protein